MQLLDFDRFESIAKKISPCALTPAIHLCSTLARIPQAIIKSQLSKLDLVDEADFQRQRDSILKLKQEVEELKAHLEKTSSKN